LKKWLDPFCGGDRTDYLRGCLHLRRWAVAQTKKWYPAFRMKAIGSRIPSTK
jgi:hypothetical protein